MTTLREAIEFLQNRLRTECKYCDLAYLCANTDKKCTFLESLEIALESMLIRTLDNALTKDKQKEGEKEMRNKAGITSDCIFEEPLDFIDINYIHLNKTVRYEKRPHGEWIIRRNRQGKHIYSVCSRCNVAHLDTDFPNFCENCGADMRKKEGDQK